MKLTKQLLLTEIHGTEWVFLLSSKCGSTSIRNMVFKHASSYQYFEQKPALSVMKHFKRVAIVRHPYGRLYSLWQDKVIRSMYRPFAKMGIKPGSPFNDFLGFIARIDDWEKVDSHLWPMSLIWYGGTTIVKLENIQERWPKELPMIGHDNENKKKQSALFLSEYHRHLIYDIYKRDFEVFRYAK